MNLYVSNLDNCIQDARLKRIFSDYGVVIFAKVIIDRMTGQSRGFGFVEMPNNEEATKAISGLDGSTNEGKLIRVSDVRPKSF